MNNKCTIKISIVPPFSEGGHAVVSVNTTTREARGDLQKLKEAVLEFYRPGTGTVEEKQGTGDGK